jgi:hypothetical protein
MYLLSYNIGKVNALNELVNRTWLNTVTKEETGNTSICCGIETRGSFIPSEPSGYGIYHRLEHNKTLHSAPTVYLCVPYGSHSQQ